MFNQHQHLPEMYIFKLNVSTFKNKRLRVIHISDVRFLLKQEEITT